MDTYYYYIYDEPMSYNILFVLESLTVYAFFYKMLNLLLVYICIIS